MKTLAALLIACSLCACATVKPRADAITDEDYDRCEQAGGCVLIAKSKLVEIFQMIRDRALAACRDST